MGRVFQHVANSRDRLLDSFREIAILPQLTVADDHVLSRPAKPDGLQ
jgi:hypothetical protein